MTLSQRIGDSKTYRIPLRWENKAFDPTGWALLYTLKSAPESQADAAAAFQKTTNGGGITTSTTNALVSVLPVNTAGGTVDEVVIPALTPGTYYWDINASKDIDGEGVVRTVSSGTLVLTRDVGRQATPSLDVVSVAPPLLYFGYQSYLDTTDDDPVLTEAQWVSRLGSSNPQVVATMPPVPSNGYTLPYEGLEWYDPSDGSTSVWVWHDPLVTVDEDDGVFVSQFPTPATTGLPDEAYVDESGDAYVDESGAYYVSE